MEGLQVAEAVAHVDLKVPIVTVVRVHCQRREQGFKVLAGEREGTVPKATTRRKNVFVEVSGAGGTIGGRRWGSAGRGAFEKGRVEFVVAGETREAKAVVEFWSVPEGSRRLLVLPVAAHRLSPGGLGGLYMHVVGVGRRWSAFVGIMNEVAARAIRTEADGVESATGLGFVLWVARQASQLVVAVRELTLFAVFARAVFLEWPAELRLVAGGVYLRARFLLQDLQLLLAALAALAVGAVAKLVLLIHYGVLLHVAVRTGGVLVAVRHGLHVAGGVSTEES